MTKSANKLSWMVKTLKLGDMRVQHENFFRYGSLPPNFPVFLQTVCVMCVFKDGIVLVNVRITFYCFKINISYLVIVRTYKKKKLQIIIKHYIKYNHLWILEYIAN